MRHAIFHPLGWVLVIVEKVARIHGDAVCPYLQLSRPLGRQGHVESGGRQHWMSHLQVFTLYCRCCRERVGYEFQ